MPLGRLQRSIVDKLSQMGLLNEEQCLALQQNPKDLAGEALDGLLQSEYRISSHSLNLAKARTYKIPPLNASRLRVTPETFAHLSKPFCQEHTILPVAEHEGLISIAVSNPFEINLHGRIREMTGRRVLLVLSSEKDIREKLSSETQKNDAQLSEIIDKLGLDYGEDGPKESAEEDLESEESAPIIRLGNQIIENAFLQQASDIHVEPQEKEVMIRYRIDGVCKEAMRLPAKAGPALVARFKIMSNLDIAERRLPQDGRIVFKQFTKRNIDIDLRVATAPLNYGEGVVMRILDKQKSTLPLPALGFSEENLTRYRAIIRQPYGMILHCGPTGSGKSMTLYSALNEINDPSIVIRTAEDPIEYTLGGINQMQMSRQIGLTFASALRAFLRQDPDIILVGEIRDQETANIAVEAALTGHLLISTLHTNDAPSTVARLTDMGIEPFMISSSLLCVCAQRLMRRVCKVCRVAYEPTPREAEILETAIGWSGTIYRHNPNGCSRCGGSGYKGRVGIHELMTVNEEIVHAINKGMETSEIKKIAMRSGMKTLHQDSMLKVKEGISTIEEALSTVPVDMT